METRNAVTRVVAALIANIQARMATQFLSPTLVVRATRRGKHSARDKRHEFVLTLGQPNYRERDFIRACKRAGEPLPVKKIQLKYPPAKRA